jgi:hypothetical protein
VISHGVTARGVTLRGVTRRGILVLLVLAGSFPALVGCPANGSVTAVDRQRYQVLAHERLLRIAVGDRVGSPGFLISPTLPPRRGYLDGYLIDKLGHGPASTGSPAPGAGLALPAVSRSAKSAARAATAKGIAALRASGWTVYFAGCTPPSASVPGDSAVPWPSPEPDEWSFDAFAYRLVGGVSYFARLHGFANGNGDVRVDFRFLTPNSHETMANLFPDQPPAVSRSGNCVESRTDPTSRTHTGPVIAMFDNGPAPGRSPTIAPSGYR